MEFANAGDAFIGLDFDIHEAVDVDGLDFGDFHGKLA
jgi:hypothetical protein